MPGLLSLSRLRFKAGPSPHAPPLEFNPPTVTVIVGPNGSGKSRLLTEIEAAARVDSIGDFVVLDDFEVVWPTGGEAREMLREFETSPPPGEAALQPGVFRIAPPVINTTQSPIDYHESGFIAAFGDQPLPEAEKNRRGCLLRYFVVRIAGRDRFNLVAQRELGDLQRPPQNHFARLFRDDELRARVANDVEAALGRYFVLDPTQPGMVRARLSDSPPAAVEFERGLDDRAIAFHSAASLLDYESDGTQSFVGLAAALHALPHRLILVDEPEAHLHPPLARRVGDLVTRLGEERGASVLAATHSVDFLMGCLFTGVAAAIVRLTYDRSTHQATARLLAAADLNVLLSDPYARSTNALEAVFHRAAVLCEADADRAFYEEVNRRLDSHGRGLPDARFIGMHTWGNIARVAAPLRRLGVPAAMIFDLDALAGMQGEWANVWAAVGLAADDPERARLEHRRLAVKAALDALPGKAHKLSGVQAFEVGSPDRVAIENLINDLAVYGIFVVPEGELEGWLRELGAPSGKKPWIMHMLPALQDVDPAEGDVWAFFDSIEAWVANLDRRGTD